MRNDIRLCTHFYTDDTQVYGFCSPSKSDGLQSQLFLCRRYCQVDGRQPTTAERSQDWWYDMIAIVSCTCGAADNVGLINWQVSHFSSAAAQSVCHPSTEIWMYGSTTVWPCPHRSPKSWPAASLRYTTTAQRTTVSVARVFHTTRGRLRAIAVGLLQRSPGWTSCQST